MRAKFVLEADIDEDGAGEADYPPIANWTPDVLMIGMTDEVVLLKTATLTVEVLVP